MSLVDSQNHVYLVDATATTVLGNPNFVDVIPPIPFVERGNVVFQVPNEAANFAFVFNFENVQTVTQLGPEPVSVEPQIGTKFPLLTPTP
jgi:hypothetical protein